MARAFTYNLLDALTKNALFLASAAVLLVAAFGGREYGVCWTGLMLLSLVLYGIHMHLDRAHQVDALEYVNRELSRAEYVIAHASDVPGQYSDRDLDHAFVRRALLKTILLKLMEEKDQKYAIL